MTINQGHQKRSYGSKKSPPQFYATTGITPGKVKLINNPSPGRGQRVIAKALSGQLEMTTKHPFQPKLCVVFSMLMK